MDYDKTDVRSDPPSRSTQECDILRKVRSLSSFSPFGILKWFLQKTWFVILFQSIYGGLNAYFNVFHDRNIHRDVLGLSPGYRPYLLGTLQYLCAFLVGLLVMDALARYTTAMSALMALKSNSESLRINLLSSTADPKLEQGVQVFLAWMTVLLEKQIVFFTEDYSKPIREHLHPLYHDSVLFKPEVIWAFGRQQWEYIVFNFLVHAQLLDSAGEVQRVYKDFLTSWKRIEDLLLVRSPRTGMYMTRFAVFIFFITIPMFNEDTCTQVMVPLVSAVFQAVIELAKEFADPWGSCYHSIPLRDVMRFIATPAFAEGSNDAKVRESIEWLNNGLKFGVTPEGNNWTHTDSENDHYNVPRTKAQYPNKDKDINFEDMRTIPQCDNTSTWETFLFKQNEDMSDAASRQRRMPQYLREGSNSSNQQMPQAVPKFDDFVRTGDWNRIISE